MNTVRVAQVRAMPTATDAVNGTGSSMLDEVAA